jgi:MFS superfamily sulfate permease-like transporter
LSWITSVAPALGWLRQYERAWLRSDAVAAVTLAAYLLPAALGDASLAGLPPQSGLYACLLSGLVFWFFCSSRHTAITVTSAISLLLGTSLGPLANGDSSRFAALAACTALLVAAMALTAWAVRAGVIVNFISETVLIGFKTGVGPGLGQHAASKALRYERISRQFLGAHGTFRVPLVRNEIIGLGTGPGRAGDARRGQTVSETQAGRPVRRRRGHRRRNGGEPG